jgi:hypothetical protein
MARKKKTSRKKTSGLGGFFSKKKKKRRSSSRSSFSAGMKITLTIVMLSVLVGGGAVGLIFLERFVKNSAAEEAADGSLKLINPPAWLNQEWVDKLVKAAGGKRFPLNESSAQEVAAKLQSLSWLENIRVQVTPEYLTIQADYRMPVGLVQVGRNQKVYLDKSVNVLDYTPVTSIPVVEIKGLASTKLPPAGQQWLADDAKAAIDLLNWLYQMDLHFQQENENRKTQKTALPGKKIPENPLLDEIESIDVSNFAARRSTSAPNIVFNIKGGVKVYWGAAWGQATVYLEADEKDKLARLYQFFVDHDNTLAGTVKYIELRWLEGNIPRPK